MFDGHGALTAKDVESFADALRDLHGRLDGELSGAIDGVVGDVERIEQLAALERLKAAAAAAQARVTAAFVDSQARVAQAWRARADECSAAGDFEGWQAARDQARRASLETRAESHSRGTGAGTEGPGVDSGLRRPRGSNGSRRATHGVAAQVALARRESPSRGSHHVALALTLTGQMPGTLAALEAGRLSEWRAGIIVRESAGLDPDQRTSLDALLCAELDSHPGGLAQWGDRELARRVRAIVYRLDPHTAIDRSTHAEQERRVTLRPAPDTMAYLTALLPVAQAVATHAALTAAADTAGAAGDNRAKGQVMADALVTRVTGQHTATAVPVEVQLVMTDRTLLAGGQVPAQLTGYGTVPAEWARRLVHPDLDDALHVRDDPASASSPDPTSDPPGRGAEQGSSTASRARVWLRRLYTDPAGRDLVAMESTRRVFDGGLRRFILTRDAGTCRTPWCDAPARHIDHIHAHADGGPTTAANAQALCIRCNHTKEEPGWGASLAPPPPTSREGPASHQVVVITPTGHQYPSLAPPPVPGHPPDPTGLTARSEAFG